MAHTGDCLGPVPPELWTQQQRQHAQEIIDGPRGALISPFVPLLRSPELMGHIQRTGEYLRYRCAIGLQLSELVILITARHWSQQVEGAIHAPIALREGIPPGVIQAIADGVRPEGMDADQSLVHDFCVQLHRDQRVSDAAWTAAVERFGEQGVVDLIAVNGYYTLLAMIMNAAQTAVPPSPAQPLPART